MPIKHSQIKIIQSLTDPSIIEVHVPHEDVNSLVKQAAKGKNIRPEFLIQILSRHLIAKAGAKTKNGSVDNW